MGTSRFVNGRQVWKVFGRSIASVFAAMLVGLTGLGATLGLASPAGALDMVSISGVVTSAVDGSPIAGAAVCASPNGWTGGMPVCMSTDAFGAYSVSVPVTGGWYGVNASEPGYLTSVPVVMTPTTGLGLVVDIVLSTVPPIQGTVTFPDGSLASDARVCAIPAWGASEFCVDVDPLTGEYSLDVEENGAYYVRFESPSGAFLTEYNPDVYVPLGANPSSVPAGATQVRPDPTGPRVVNATVVAGSTISGILTDDVDTTLTTPVKVCAYVDGVVWECVDTTGPYTLTDIPPGTITLEFGESAGMYGLTPWTDPAGGSVATPIVINSGGQTLTAYDASLTAQYLLDIFVRDIAGGPLVEGISICVVPSSGEQRCVVTGPESPYLFIPAGPFTLRFSDPLGRYATEYWEDASDLANATWINPHDVAGPTLFFDAVVPIGAMLQRISAATTTTASPTTTSSSTVPTTTAAGGVTTTTGVTTTPVTTATSTTVSTTTTGAAATTTTAAPATTTPTQVLGATQTAAKPVSRTGGNGIVLLGGIAVGLMVVGGALLFARHKR